MNEYDSILKEKKKIEPIIEDATPKKKKFPTFILSLISIILILIISYVIYYNTILAKQNIIINNITTLKKQYNNILNNLYLEELSNKNLQGDIVIDNNQNYSFIKSKNNYYLKTPSLEKYINNQTENNLNINITNHLKDIKEAKYIKTFYLNEKTPIIEVNLILERTDLEKIIGKNLMNEYEMLITSRNHALTNKIIELKIVLTDKITTKRKVITIENSTIHYKDENKDLTFYVNIKNNDFNIKIYKNDNLYSVITGTEKISTYDYSYQIIDELYTINLSTRRELDKYIYEFNSSIEDVKSTANLTITNQSNELEELVNFNDLTDSDKQLYQSEKNILLEFINKYKNNI